MRRVRKDCKFTIDENYSSIKTLTSILILANFVGQIYSTVVPSAFPQQNHDQAVGENMELVGETETDFQFTDCDHLFDASLRQGHFSLPIFPKEAITDFKAPDINDDIENEESDIREQDNDNKITRSPFVTISIDDSNEIEDKERAVHYQSLPDDIQCIYTFMAKPRERVRLQFTSFQLAGTANHCESEYVDVYSELEDPTEDLLSANLDARYCGTVAPNVRISLHQVLVLVLHSRIGRRRGDPFVLAGTFEFIPEAQFVPGIPFGPSNGKGCAFLIESSNRNQGTILSPTYPGAYPSNFHCVYLLKGKQGERIRLYFKDFDVYFGGEHCPYDSLTIYDGDTNSEPILRKLCGLQQRLELFSFGTTLLLEFNTTEPPKNDMRGFAIDYEFSTRFVDIVRLIGPQRRISHIRGSECDIRVRSNRESVHYIQSPNFPEMFPLNTTCTYVLDGLQSDQNLEKVLLHFEAVAMSPSTASNENILPLSSALAPNTSKSMEHSPSGNDDCNNGAFVGIATTAASIKSALTNSEESSYDAILCDTLSQGNNPSFVSQGPRIVLVFSSLEQSHDTSNKSSTNPRGFRARVEFKTDFGIAGESIGGSNRCAFRFHDPTGSFNSPRYPANYPLDTECTYHIVHASTQQHMAGISDKQILLHFKQFALFEDKECNDWLKIFDVFYESDGTETLRLQAQHCWNVFPGPTISSFGAHEMRVVFHSDGFGTANGFDAHYEIRDAFEEEVPHRKDKRHCGELIQANEELTTGHFESPGYPVKYGTNKQCDWEIRVRSGHQVLLRPNAFNIEGQMTDEKIDCMSAVFRVHLDMQNRSRDLQLCGENIQMIPPIVSPSNSIRMSFLTSPDKVNGLQGFNFSWTEVRRVQSDSECTGEQFYLCSYSRLCIDAQLRCNGEDNCGENDDSDEAHCSRIDNLTDMRTIVVAYIVSGLIFLFIFSFFCILFKSKLKRKNHAREDLRRKSQRRRKRQKSGHRGTSVHHRYPHQSGSRLAGETNTTRTPRLRQPFRQSKPKQTILDKHRLSGAVTMITRLSEDESLHLPMYDNHHQVIHDHLPKLSPTLEEQPYSLAINGTNVVMTPEQNIEGNVKIFYG
uniref:CUB domain-containing protein n=1 Tax=Meloidogyne incognita TaxID=6306 RepID=A0A914KHY1_MELIC